MYIVGKNIIYLFSLRDSLFYLFLMLVQINLIFSNNIHILYIYIYILTVIQVSCVHVKTFVHVLPNYTCIIYLIIFFGNKLWYILYDPSKTPK